jgi:hypothetical protein
VTADARGLHVRSWPAEGQQAARSRPTALPSSTMRNVAHWD